MKTDKKIAQLINKELRGTLSPDERRILNQWYDSGTPKLEPLSDWELVKLKTKNYKLLEKKLEVRKHFGNYGKMVWLAAAGLSLFLISTWLFSPRPEYSHDVLLTDDFFEKIVNPKGVRNRIILPDSSMIYLNGSSSLKIHRNFINNRKIILEGEAFFEVKKDEHNPFFVESSGILTRVLGTSFNIKAFLGEPLVVSVQNGRVNVYPLRENNKSEILEANEQITIDRDQTMGRIQKFDPFYEMAWVEGRLVFDKTPIMQVFKELENWYGLESIEFDSKNMNCLVTGTYTKMTLKEIMESIQYATKIKYELKGKNLIIKKGNC